MEGCVRLAYITTFSWLLGNTTCRVHRKTTLHCEWSSTVKQRKLTHKPQLTSQPDTHRYLASLPSSPVQRHTEVTN